MVSTDDICRGICTPSLNQVMLGWGLPLAMQVKFTDWYREAKTVDGPVSMTGGESC